MRKRPEGAHRRPLDIYCIAFSTLLGLAAAFPNAGEAQGVRVRLDTRAQWVSYRGIVSDSIPSADTVTGPNGGPQTGDGFAVRCRPGIDYCHFFRPGPVLRAAPVVTTAEGAVWGLGISGLSLHATARAALDLGAAGVWPGTSPAMQLLEGYVQYAVPQLTARAGRQYVASRLGFQGFDGARLTLRHRGLGLEFTGYGGWGLAHGVPLPVTSPALNPLDDFQPRNRELLTGAQVGVTRPPVALRAVYEREFDPGPSYLVGERAGIGGSLDLPLALSFSGGADYDLAMGWWGSADATLGFAPVGSWLAAAAGARRYRPHFDLWTIWGAFSPVPYHAVFGSVALRSRWGVRLRARGEQYWFAPTEAETPLVVGAKDGGWRWTLGASYSPKAPLTIDAGYYLELGPGAGAGGMDGAILYTPHERFRVSIYGAMLERPLEFRFNQSSLRAFGLEAEYRPSARLRIGADLSRYDEIRDRPDAAAVDWDQFRATTRFALLLGSTADQARIPPAVRRMPSGGGRR